MPTSRKTLNPPTDQSADTGREDPVYPKPTVSVAPNGFLSPSKVTAAGLEVVVEYRPMKLGDVIALKFNGDDTFVPIKVEGQTPVSFWVSVSHIIEALGTTVDIQYTLGGTSFGEKSEILQLTVLPFMEGDLKMAKVEQATDGALGELDLSKFPGDADISIQPWPLMAAGQRVWLDMVSNKGTSNILKSYPVTATDISIGVTQGISRTELQEIADNSEITFPLKVQFDGTDTTVGAKDFPTLRLRLMGTAGGTEYCEDFEGFVPRPIAAPFETVNMTFSFGAIAYHPNEVVSQDGSICLKMHAQKIGGIVIVNFKHGIIPSYVSFDLAVTDGACVVSCYNSSDTINQERGVSEFKNMRFDAPGIRELRFQGIDYTPIATQFLLDNFRFNGCTETRSTSADHKDRVITKP